MSPEVLAQIQNRRWINGLTFAGYVPRPQSEEEFFKFLAQGVDDYWRGVRRAAFRKRVREGIDNFLAGVVLFLARCRCRIGRHAGYKASRQVRRHYRARAVCNLCQVPIR